MKGHTVFPAIVEDSHLLFSILAEDGIAASAEPVSSIKRLGQGLERADRLRVKTADEKTAFRMNDLSMTSFAVIKHGPHLPFRYGSIIAGAVYNNTDSWGYADTGTPETQKNRLKRRFFGERRKSTTILIEYARFCRVHFYFDRLSINLPTVPAFLLCSAPSVSLA